MFDTILHALNERDAALEARQTEILDELDGLKTERNAISAQVKLIEKLDVEFLAPFVAPPVLMIPGPKNEEDMQALRDALKSEIRPGDIQLLETSRPVEFQRVKRLPEINAEPEFIQPAPLAPPIVDEAVENQPDAADLETARLLEEAIAAPPEVAGSNRSGIRPKLVAYLLRAADANGNLLVDESFIAKKLGSHMISIMKAVDILVVEGKIEKRSPPKGMLSLWVNRKALEAETL